MLNFLLDLHELYSRNNNPFHNFTHAITVLHGCFYLIVNTSFVEILEPFDILLLFVAAIGHDVDHTGYSNAHEIARQSKLAIRYNDESVLENHHASTTFEILSKKESSILDGFSED